MRIVLFYHSLLSDWNHGNAHFLRGVISELIDRGHEVRVYEPQDSWSLSNLIQDHGTSSLDEFRTIYPGLSSSFYTGENLCLDEKLDGADLVLVHEWNSPDIVEKIGLHRAQNPSYKLLFHDTHHRIVTNFAEMARFDLRHYDGVLAFGQKLSDLYLSRGLAERVWTWHEAADTRVFFPRSSPQTEGELIWVGNWGDEERTAEIQEFLVTPATELGLNTRIHGVRYPEEAKTHLKKVGLHYQGWLPNFKVPDAFARFHLTLHIPRRPYVEALPGIPTIRVFEALACGIPLISAPWDDAENLFRPGEDFLVAKNGTEMRQKIQSILQDPALANSLRTKGLERIRERHTCKHRVNELFEFYGQCGGTSCAQNPNGPSMARV